MLFFPGADPIAIFVALAIEAGVAEAGAAHQLLD